MKCVTWWFQIEFVWPQPPTCTRSPSCRWIATEPVAVYSSRALSIVGWVYRRTLPMLFNITQRLTLTSCFFPIVTLNPRPPAHGANALTTEPPLRLELLFCYLFSYHLLLYIFYAKHILHFDSHVKTLYFHSQDPLIHVWVSLVSPGQLLLRADAAGFWQTRILSCSPVPQVNVQADHFDHCNMYFCKNTSLLTGGSSTHETSADARTGIDL